METKEILTEIDGTITELALIASSIDDGQFNAIPFEGSWTPGQLVKHVVMSGSGFVEIINGPVEETKRAPDELVEKIKVIFLDFTTKMKSPDFIVPPDSQYNKEELLNALKDIQNGMDQAIESADLTKTCVAFKLPNLGFLTRMEAVYFVIYHTQRHIHQLKNMYQEADKSQTDAA